MKIAILGWGKQGQSAYEYWGKDKSNQITVCDHENIPDLPADVSSQLGENYLANLQDFDLIIRSPGVHPRDVKGVEPAKITTNTNEFFKVCPSKKIIGVTGTKGKGTTSTLIARMLSDAGFRVHLGGNIGIAPLAMLNDNIQPDDWVVLELANFQLIDLEYSPKIAVCLMVVPEHLNWHTSLEEYYNSKQQIFNHQNADDIAIYNSQNAQTTTIASASAGRKIGYLTPLSGWVDGDSFKFAQEVICPTSDMKLLGHHNRENVCAAITAVWQITQDKEAIKKVIRTFSGLPYHLELIRELDGVRYYNDSFGTTPETAIVAFQAFSEPKIGIVGGSDKGIPFDAMAETIIRSKTRALICLGDTGPKIAELVREANKSIADFGDIEIRLGARSMEEAVEQARECAQPGDIVLLSTGCASFGLFKNYYDRGDQFTKAVQELA